MPIDRRETLKLQRYTLSRDEQGFHLIVEAADQLAPQNWSTIQAVLENEIRRREVEIAFLREAAKEAEEKFKQICKGDPNGNVKG